MSEEQASVLRKVEEKADAVLQEDNSESMNAFIDSLADPVLNVGMQTTGLPLCELEGLDKSLRGLRGMISIQESKRVAAEEEIKRYEEKIQWAAQEEKRTGTPADREVLDDYRKKLEEGKDHLKAVESSLNDLKGESRQQVRAIKELIGRVLREDTSLASKVREIFREQGIMIGAIIAALGAIIAALVEGLTGGTSGGSAGGAAGSSGGDGGDKPRSARKRAFDALAKGLRWLGDKAATALPGIIGSVVSFLLKGVAAVATWLGSNLWAVLIGVRGIAYGVLQWAVRDRGHQTNKTKSKSK